MSDYSELDRQTAEELLGQLDSLIDKGHYDKAINVGLRAVASKDEPGKRRKFLDRLRRNRTPDTGLSISDFKVEQFNQLDVDGMKRHSPYLAIVARLVWILRYSAPDRISGLVYDSLGYIRVNGLFSGAPIVFCCYSTLLAGERRFDEAQKFRALALDTMQHIEVEDILLQTWFLLASDVTSWLDGFGAAARELDVLAQQFENHSLYPTIIAERARMDFFGGKNLNIVKDSLMAAVDALTAIGDIRIAAYYGVILDAVQSLTSWDSDQIVMMNHFELATQGASKNESFYNYLEYMHKLLGVLIYYVVEPLSLPPQTLGSIDELIYQAKSTADPATGWLQWFVSLLHIARRTPLDLSTQKGNQILENPRSSIHPSLEFRAIIMLAMAENLRQIKDIYNAQNMYKKVIKLSKQEGLAHVHAISTERYVNFLGDTDVALTNVEKYSMREQYNHWGAVRKTVAEIRLQTANNTTSLVSSTQKKLPDEYVQQPYKYLVELVKTILTHPHGIAASRIAVCLPDGSEDEWEMLIDVPDRGKDIPTKFLNSLKNVYQLDALELIDRKVIVEDPTELDTYIHSRQPAAIMGIPLPFVNAVLYFEADAPDKLRVGSEKSFNKALRQIHLLLSFVRDERDRQRTPQGRAQAFCQSLLEQPKIAIPRIHGALDSANYTEVPGQQLLKLISINPDSSIEAEVIDNLIRGLSDILDWQGKLNYAEKGLARLVSSLDLAQDHTLEWQSLAETHEAVKKSYGILISRTVSSLQGDHLTFAESAANSSEYPGSLLSRFNDILRQLANYHLSDKTGYKAFLNHIQAQLLNLHYQSFNNEWDGVLYQVVWKKLADLVTLELQNLEKAEIQVKLLTTKVFIAEQIPFLFQIANNGWEDIRDLEVSIGSDTSVKFENNQPIRWPIFRGQDNRYVQSFVVVERQPDSRISIDIDIAYRTINSDYLHEETQSFAVVLEEHSPFDSNLLNPYATGKPLLAGSKVFVGRRELINDIRDTLETGPGLILVGRQRLGKTSLLYQLSDYLADFCSIVIFDCYSRSDALSKIEVIRRLADLISHEFGIPYDISNSMKDLETHFELFLTSLFSERLAGRRLVVAIDEYAEFETYYQERNSSPEILKYLKSLVGRFNSNFCIILAGQKDLGSSGLHSDYGDALQLYPRQNLGYLTHEDVMELLAVVDLKYDEFSKYRIVKLTGGHPSLANSLCAKIFATAREASRSSIDWQIVDEAAYKVVNALGNTILREMLPSSDSIKARILEKIAFLEQSQSYLNGVPREVLLEQLETNANEDVINVSIEELTTDLVLEEIRHSVYAIRVGLLSKYISLHMGNQI